MTMGEYLFAIALFLALAFIFSGIPSKRNK